MRWLRHMASSRRDARLLRLRTQHGLWGYGFWWLTLEIVAEHVPPGSSAAGLAWPLAVWAGELGVKRQLVPRGFLMLADLGLIRYEISACQPQDARWLTSLPGPSPCGILPHPETVSSDLVPLGTSDLVPGGTSSHHDSAEKSGTSEISTPDSVPGGTSSRDYVPKGVPKGVPSGTYSFPQSCPSRDINHVHRGTRGAPRWHCVEIINLAKYHDEYMQRRMRGDATTPESVGSGVRSRSEHGLILSSLDSPLLESLEGRELSPSPTPPSLKGGRVWQNATGEKRKTEGERPAWQQCLWHPRASGVVCLLPAVGAIGRQGRRLCRWHLHVEQAGLVPTPEALAAWLEHERPYRTKRTPAEIWALSTHEGPRD